MRAAFWKGNAEQNRPAISRFEYRSKAGTLGEFFGLIDNETEGGFDGHSAIDVERNIFYTL